MSDAGRHSGERAERLRQQALRDRSPMEVFADEFMLVNIVVLLVGAVLGAVTLSNTIPQSVQADFGWVAYWMANRLVGLVAGLAVAFLVIDVPLTATVLWLRKNRPELFQSRR